MFCFSQVLYFSSTIVIEVITFYFYVLGLCLSHTVQFHGQTQSYLM